MQWLSTKKNIILFLFPAMLFYLVYIISPIIMTTYYSFTDFQGIGTPEFIGIDNYVRMFSDKFFFIALKNTSIVLCIALLLLLPLSFLMGLMLSKAFKGNTVAKALVFSPNVIAPIIIGVIWVYILDPHMGVVNNILGKLGFASLQHEWIGGRILTPYSVGLVYIWQVIGFNATIFLTGIKMIPKDIYEAAKIDGASESQQLMRITLPMLKETFIINIVLILTNALKIFELVVQMTGGGPNNLSQVLNTYMYYRTFTTTEYGYGMAIAVFVLVLASVISVTYIKNARRKLT